MRVCVCKTEHPSNITASPAVRVSGRCRSPSQLSRGRVTSQVTSSPHRSAPATTVSDRTRTCRSFGVASQPECECTSRGCGRSQGTWSEPRQTRGQSGEWNQQPSCCESPVSIAAPPSCFASISFQLVSSNVAAVAGPFNRRDIPPAVARLLLRNN